MKYRQAVFSESIHAYMHTISNNIIYGSLNKWRLMATWDLKWRKALHDRNDRKIWNICLDVQGRIYTGNLSSQRGLLPIEFLVRLLWTLDMKNNIASTDSLLICMEIMDSAYDMVERLLAQIDIVFNEVQPNVSQKRSTFTCYDLEINSACMV
ncbi:hypothetical protein NC653_028955 [Populus alba x Populus x berolinensis]|uniref:Uncharacterized protein n=1 Tax=Populus alba x Populus x berolinensis TaxID=444605 RepID=A0AAD6M1B3_9ROSI|nr:hypothetical protein NC653_028955 [Populus alba x Populus x berolinensis]